MTRKIDPGGDVPIDLHLHQFSLREVAFLSRLTTDSIRNWRVRGIVDVGLQNPLTARFRYSVSDALTLAIMQGATIGMAFNPRDAAKLASMAVPLAHASTAPGQQPVFVVLGWEADGRMVGTVEHGSIPFRPPAASDNPDVYQPLRRLFVVLPITAMAIDMMLRTQHLQQLDAEAFEDA